MADSSNPSDPLAPGLRLAFPAAVFLAAFLAFSPALAGAFLNWDDNLVLTDHHEWRGLGGEQVAWAFSTFRAGHYHPLTWMSFGLDHELWGMNPRGFHLVNLLLHATTAVIFYFILLRLVGGTGLEIVARLAAAAGALFFAIHPLRVESVAWITERRDVLSGCLLLLTVLAWLRWTGGEGGKWYAVALGAFVLSLLSKAWGITLPVVLLLMDVYPLRRCVEGKRAAILLEKAPFFAFAAAAGVLAIVAQKRAGAMDFAEGHTLVDRVVQSGYGLFFYVAKTLLPVAPNPLYALKASFNPFDVLYLAGAVASAALTVGLIVVRKRHPGMLAAWAVYAVSVAPVLGLTQSGPQLVAERYSYLACLPFAALAAAGLAAWISRSGVRIPALVAAVVVAALGVQAWRYSHDWRDSVSLWTVALERDPENAQAWYNRGQARLDLGDKQGAFDDLTRSIEFNPRNASAHINRGVARMERDPDGAFADFSEAVRLRPTSADALVNRGWVRLARKDTDGALADIGEAIKIDPIHYQARLRRAIVLLQRGESAAARSDLDEAIRLKPSEPDAWYVRGQAHDEEQEWDAAIADYARALNVGGAGWDPRKRKRAEELLARARQRKAGR